MRTDKKDKDTVVIFSPNRNHYFCFWKKDKNYFWSNTAMKSLQEKNIIKGK